MIFILLLIGITLAFFSIFQILYIAYLSAIEREHKTKIRELERKCKSLMKQNADMSHHFVSQNTDLLSDEETWADVIAEK